MKTNQYQQNNNKQQQDKQYQYASSGSSSSRTQIRACLNKQLEDMQLEQLVPLYSSVFGMRGIPQPIGEFFVRLLRAGMELPVIASAISATAWARVPTPFYMRAILQRYLEEGIMTEAQLNHDRMEKDKWRGDLNDEKEERMYF